MVDRDFVAVEFAKKNAEINGFKNCQTYLSNGFSKVLPTVKFDNVVSNLFTNSGKEMISTVISDAKEYLKPEGKIYLVTITAMREFVKRDLQEIFGNYEKPIQTSRYTVHVATK